MGALPWIDWDAAERVGAALVPPGPKAERGEMDAVVAELRRDASRATRVIARVSGLPETSDASELVVDRRTLVRANVRTGRAMLAELDPGDRPGTLERIAGRGRGATVGAALAVLGSRVLGQYDPFAPRPVLMLSAPTILAVERHLGVVPRDFRMWVVLHEQTHRVQFANAPWLRDHVVGLVRRVVLAEAESEPFWNELASRLAGIRRDREEGRPFSLRVMDAVSSSQTVAAMDDMTAVMSLVEGHADVMMDRAGPSVIPTVRTIRARFDQRRSQGGITGLINRLLGLDAKLAQYSDGAEFCRRVIDAVGVEGLNSAFSSASRLPSLPELLHPEQWLARVHPRASTAAGDGQA